MKGKVKFKDDSNYRYAGMILDIINIHQVHQDERMNDIYPVGSVTWKLSLKGTQWEKDGYTIIHDSHLESIDFDGNMESEIWYSQFNLHGRNVMDKLFNLKGDKTVTEIYE